MRSPRTPGRPVRRRRLFAALFAFSLLAALLPTQADAQQQQQQNEIVLSVDFDGTPSFSTSDPDDDGLGSHTPGLDLNDANNVVRTWDQVQYRIDWNVNEVDGTDTTIRMTLPAGVEWMEDGSTVTGVPSGCTDDGTSSITGNDGRELVCVTDGEHEGSNGAIHPRALVKALLDGTPLTVGASIQTGERAPIGSNEITTYVSATPKGDWVKGKPIEDSVSGAIIGYEPDEMYFGVDGPSADDPNVTVPGRLFVWNLRLEPSGGLKGAEPMNDSLQIDLWDHFFDSVPGTRLATPAQMFTATGLHRVPCGGYDGSDGYPYGVTAGVTPTTPAAQTNTGTWTCSDVSDDPGYGFGYPVIKIEIDGQDTTNIAPQNADLSPNSSALTSGQIAFWAPENELIAKLPIPRIVVNAITGSPDQVVAGSTTVDPIQVHGTNSSIGEFSEPGDGMAGLSNNSPYEFPTSPPSNPGRSFRHWVKYLNGPYAEVEYESFASETFRSYDHRTTSYGGTGRGITNGQDGVDGSVSDNYAVRWDGDGQTPRGNVLTVHANLQTITSRPNATSYSNPVHLCVAVDTTHQEVIAMPASFPVSILGDYTGSGGLNGSSYVLLRNTVGGYSATPASPLAQVLIGTEGTGTWPFWGNNGLGPRIDAGSVDYTIEFASSTPAGAQVDVNGISCNSADADGRGWVDGKTGNLEVFRTGTAPDGTAVYGDITHVRVRTEGDVPWQGRSNGANTSYGTRLELGFQVRVKDNPVDQAADQELFLYASRGSGIWDGAGQPPTPACANWKSFMNRDADDPDTDNDGVFDYGERDESDDDNYESATQTPGIPLGWCNLDFADDAVNVPACAGVIETCLADFKNDFDSSVVEYVDSLGRPRGAHADAVYIVEPALAISKVNTDGPADITGNGDTVEFEVNPKVIGSSLDTIADVTVTDNLPSTMAFAGFTSLPSQGSCSESSGTITCTYGSQAGGWGSQGEGTFSFDVTIQNAGANATLTNTATIAGNDSNTGDPKTPASSKASAFTGAPFEESGIEKAVDQHLTTCFDTPGATMALGDCTVIAVDGGMVFSLDIENEGNVDLENYRVIDVLPHLADETEPPSAAHPSTSVALTGDGRTPPSDFTGSLEFVNVAAPAGATVLYSAEPATSISRDPAVAETATTWCDAPAGGDPVIAGLGAAAGTAPCPATAAEVTAVHFDLGTLDKGATEVLEIRLTTVDADCGDIWTNNFGARTSGLLLPMRSNDVSVMAGFCDPTIDIEKATNGLDSDVSDGAQILVGDPVTWTYVISNDGDVALADATVTDVPAPVGGIDCDVDGDGTLDGTPTIPLLVPGASVTCEATGIAAAGPFANNASVSGNPVLPDFAAPGVDPADPSTWPTDAGSYSEPLDPVTGAAVLADPTAADPSHYTGVDLTPGIDIEKDTNGVQSDTGPGEQLTKGQGVTWTYVVTNTGTAVLLDAEVTDSDPTVVVDCDVDGDTTLDGTNTIALLVPGESVTCEATGSAKAGPYMNTASVTGDMARSITSCVCDPTDPTTWPTEPGSYAVHVDPVTNQGTSVSDADDSHYTGVGPAVDVEKDTNGVQSDAAPGETIVEGADITWTYVVTNSGDTALLDATVTDSDASVTVDCDVDGDARLDGSNVIPLLLPGAVVSCRATGVAGSSAYMNTAAVAAAPALPDVATCGCDPADATTWPTDPTGYVQPLTTAGQPIPPVSDSDDSHYLGERPVATIGGVVWNDVDKDGVQDSDEEVRPGATVELLDEGGNPVLDAHGEPIVTTTGADGEFQFDVAPGDYRLRFTAPDGTSLTPGGGNDDDADGNGMTGIIGVDVGDDVRGVDAGVAHPAPPELAFTGADSTTVPVFAAIMMLLGLLLLGAARHRESAASHG